MAHIVRHYENAAEMFFEYDKAHRWDTLGTYNSERSRGLVHTPEWDKAMAEEQAKFDEEHGIRREP